MKVILTLITLLLADTVYSNYSEADKKREGLVARDEDATCNSCVGRCRTIQKKSGFCGCAHHCEAVYVYDCPTSIRGC
ncbi:hypothetical protein Vi05172_g13616 [Venturia inaequalis]|nr:hypothetical protein Vi05172_g13616 [Venturia inaequalis]